MRDAARGMHFELAAVYRDQLAAIDKVREEQRVVAIDDIDRDVLGLHREGDLVELALLHIRRGKLADVATFSIKNAEVPDEEVVAAFLAQHYALCRVPREATSSRHGARRIPDEVIVPVLPEAASGIAEWLAERAQHKVMLLYPQRGHSRRSARAREREREACVRREAPRERRRQRAPRPS